VRRKLQSASELGLTPTVVAALLVVVSWRVSFAPVAGDARKAVFRRPRFSRFDK
jgi:hypothetical protein